MPEQPEDLDVRFRLAKEFVSSIQLIESQERTSVRLTFSVDSAIADPQEREELLESYRAGLTEAMAQLPERLPAPLQSRNDGKLQEMSATALTDAMAHIRAVFEGTHRWSWRFAPDLRRDSVEARKVVSGCSINLVLYRLEENHWAWDLFFLAMLYDLRNIGPEDLVRPLDLDPPLEDNNESPT